MATSLLSDRLDALFPEVSWFEFYRDLFPEGSFEERGVYESGRYNGIIVEIAGDRALRHTVTDDLRKIQEVASRRNFCIMSPISYIGKSRKSENAREMFALAIDLDGVDTEEGFRFFLRQIERGEEMTSFVWGLPRPTYIVSSGTGMHLYYVFERPIRLFPNAVKELERLKKRLTWQAWTQGASTLHDRVQYESLVQGFRVVGTETKVGTVAKAFRVGGKVTVEYLNRFVPGEHRAEGFGYVSRTSLGEAREKWPAWYERRVVKGTPRGTWTCKRDLYDWWMRKLRAGAEQGHRYWCVMTLAVYAKKSGVPPEELERDALGLIDFLNEIGDGTDPFTESDVRDALKAYDDSYMTYPIDTIAERTGIAIEKNKRNGRKQRVHLMGARAIQQINDEVNGTNWRDGNGRKPKRDLVRSYASEHPEANHSEIARALGVSRPTVIKWLK